MSIMKNVCVKLPRSRFPVKLISCIAIGSASNFVVYLKLLQLVYNNFGNRDNLLGNQLCNHHLDQKQFS